MRPCAGFLLAWFVPQFLILSAATISAQQPQLPNPAVPLPEAPMPLVVPNQHGKGEPCRIIPMSQSAGVAVGTMAGAMGRAVVGVPFSPGTAARGSQSELPPCPPAPPSKWLFRFLNGPGAKPLTPSEKARLAAKNVVDPFNAVTIVLTSGIAIASDAHSPYGPGFPGFGRNVGVAYAQDMTGEFFGVFLIPSIVHQDPRYYRMPKAPILRRVEHAALQVVWTKSDDGKGMLNYGNLVGFAIDDEISNLYVPGRSTNLPASAARYGTGLLFAPTDYLITEFLPDVARHIHVQVVIVQRIINQVAKPDMVGAP
jgi:hypothetical protein